MSGLVTDGIGAKLPVEARVARRCADDPGEEVDDGSDEQHSLEPIGACEADFAQKQAEARVFLAAKGFFDLKASSVGSGDIGYRPSRSVINIHGSR